MDEGSRLEYLERKVNNNLFIERTPIKILFASDETLRMLKNEPELINDNSLFIDSDITMLGLDKLGNQRRFSTVDGLEVSSSKGILLIEAKDVTEALLKRLDSITDSCDSKLDAEMIVTKRIREVERKIDGSISLLNKLLIPNNQVLSSEDKICVGLFIDYKLTDVDEFGLTGDIGLLREEIDEYSEGITDTIIFTNKSIRKMEDLIREYTVVCEK